MASHRVAAMTPSSIKDSATFQSSQSCHRRRCESAQSKLPEDQKLSPYKVQEAVYSILERSGGDLDRASQMLDERLSVTNQLIQQLANTSDSLSHEEFRARLRVLKTQHRSVAEMTEDLRAATDVASNGHQQGRSVTFDDAKPPLPPTTTNGSGSTAAARGGRRYPGLSAAAGTAHSASYDNLADYEQRAASREDEERRHEQQELLRNRVKALWSDFDVHGSRQRSGSLDRSWRPSSVASHDDDLVESWRHRVTVPQPFSMTLREEAEKEAQDQRQQLRKSRSMRILEADERHRRATEEAELRVRPRAAPVPAHVYQPLLRQLENQRDARRREVREHSAEILRATERPFSFTKRDAERKRQGRERLTEADQRRGYHRSAVGDREATVIRAKPAPPSCAAERSRQLREEAEQRRANARVRSEATLRAAAMPGEMAERQRRMEAKRDAKIVGRSGRPGSADGRLRVGRDAPDFDRLHRQFELEMLEKQSELRVTRPQPFHLLTGKRAHVAQQHMDKCLASGQDPKALRTLYDFSRRYPTDPADDADAADNAEAKAAAAERERRRRIAMSRDPEEEYRQKLLELDRKMKERDQLLAEQARLLAQEKACARYRQSLLQAGVDPARVAALVRAYRERELAAAFGDLGDDAYDGLSSVPNESEYGEEFKGNLDETRFGAPSPVPN